MHRENNNKTKVFVQGLRPFSSSIPKNLKKHLRKGGFNYSSIVDNWTKIVNKEISDACYPVTVKMRKEMRNGTLILNVHHGKEMEVEYKKKTIIDKINSFFGYNCIDQISLKIVQDKIVLNKKKFSTIKNFDKIKKKMSEVKDKDLKNSLNNFLKAFNERDK